MARPGRGTPLRPVTIIQQVELTAGTTLDQYGYRFYDDDGDEDASTALAAQNTPVSIDKLTPARLRVGSDATGDPASQSLKLQYRKVGDTTWIDIN